MPINLYQGLETPKRNVLEQLLATNNFSIFGTTVCPPRGPTGCIAGCTAFGTTGCTAIVSSGSITPSGRTGSTGCKCPKITIVDFAKENRALAIGFGVTAFILLIIVVILGFYIFFSRGSKKEIK